MTHAPLTMPGLRRSAESVSAHARDVLLGTVAGLDLVLWNYTMASLIFAGFSLGMIAGFILAGLVIARRGPRAAALCGAVLHLSADLLFVFGHSVGAYSTARVVQGAGAGFVWMSPLRSPVKGLAQLARGGSPRRPTRRW